LSKKIKLKFNKRAFEDLRHEAKVQADLKARAEKIAAAASDNGAVPGYIVTELKAEDPRAAVSVMATGHARYHDRKNLSLLRNIEKGK